MRQAGRSVLVAAVDEAAEWSESEYLLARVSDALELSNYLFYSANAAEGADEWPAPTPIRRPGEEEPDLEPATHTYASTDEVVDFFKRMTF